MPGQFKDEDDEEEDEQPVRQQERLLETKNKRVVDAAEEYIMSTRGSRDPYAANDSNLETSNMTVDLAGHAIANHRPGDIISTRPDVRSSNYAPSITFSESTFYLALSHSDIPAKKIALGELRE
jgi:hypothetical protein